MATAPPSGTVTFLFTDIEGSAQLWDREPIAMTKALETHDRIIRGAAEAHQGYVFSTAGDAFSIAYARSEPALATALKVQRELHQQGVPFRVRMAMHVGVASERDGDYFGRAPNRCARLLSIANGGQLLLSAAAYELLKEELPEGVGSADLGSHRLRDLAEPEHVFEVLHPNSGPSRPLRSLSELPNNLPAQLTSFVGRVNELEEAAKLLRGSRL
ncbi:MAG TPA: adenylate/guanylate cyclase domain-containing protein, partial [Acidimicrobiia bacterium]